MPARVYASNVGGASRQGESITPECVGRMNIVDDAIQRPNETRDVFLAGYKRRIGLQDHEMVPAHLTENSLPLKKSHDDYLAEHAGVNGTKCSERQTQ